MKSLFRFCSYFLALACLLSSCSKNDIPKNEQEEEEVADMTVLVYMSADNSLISFSKMDLNEMLDGINSIDTGKNHLLVYYDGYGTPRLFEVTIVDGQPGYKIYKTYNTFINSCSYESMSQIFQDSFLSEQFKAKNYALVMWSHGEGWIPYPQPSQSATTRWIGSDETNLEGVDRMNIHDFCRALSLIPHLNYVLFEACYMGSVEVAYEMRKYTDYVVACPTEIPGLGAPYDKILPYLFEVGAEEKIALAYYSHYESMYDEKVENSDVKWTGGVSIAVIKSDELEALAVATGQTFSSGTIDPSTLVNKVFNYDKRSDSRYIGYYDISSLMEATAKSNEALESWKNVYARALPLFKTTPMNYADGRMFSMRGATGLSHYIPRYLSSQAAAAYRSFEWYKAAGLENLGW